LAAGRLLRINMSKSFKFELICGDKSGARRGRFHTARGTVETPVFMPVGTAGTVKSLTPEQVADAGAKIILGNTYHLTLRPGADVVKAHGGLHKFMNWNGSILTDSGGYQVFSLAKIRKITDAGVKFQSHIDGTELFLSPESAMEIQMALGSDIAMALDICPHAYGSKEETASAVKTTTAWAKRCLARRGEVDQALFGITQGALYPDLRVEHAQELSQLPFEGMAVGGLSVGETNEEMYRTLSHVAPHLPQNKPRYLMGVGLPQNLVECVRLGIDMFDCVLPTRNARNALLYTQSGEVNVRNSEHKNSVLPPDETCDCYTCRNYTLSYLRHLHMAGEMLAATLCSIHNVRFFIRLMERARAAIEAGKYDEFRAEFYQARGEIVPENV